MTSRMDAMFREADPVISSVLDSALAGKEISISDGSELYSATGISFHLTGMVADEIRRQKVGETVTYVVNRNINFTNVCIKQCGFCAFSRDFREEEGYMLPVQEIVRRAAEAHSLGATEVCIQAGLPPDMEPDTYESICRAIKEEIPKHPHTRLLARRGPLRSPEIRHHHPGVPGTAQRCRGGHVARHGPPRYLISSSETPYPPAA